MSIKLISRWDALKVCENCGKKEIIQKAAYLEIIRKKRKCICRTCINKELAKRPKKKAEKSEPKNFYIGNRTVKQVKVTRFIKKVGFLP